MFIAILKFKYSKKFKNVIFSFILNSIFAVNRNFITREEENNIVN